MELPSSAPDLHPRTIGRLVGHRGWVGMRLDGDLDWDDVEELCELAHRTVSPVSR